MSKTKTDRPHPDFLYRVTITELEWDDFDVSTTLYEQTVEDLDIRAVIEAVNLKDADVHILPRKRAPRSDRGKARKPVHITPEEGASTDGSPAPEPYVT